jgi:hypothetical protein
MKRTLSLMVILFLAAGAFAQVKKKEEPKKTSGTKTSIPDGYGGVKWGTLLSKAREGIAGKLVFTDEKTLIISRDGDLEYHYGFFYVDPAVSPVDKVEEKKDKSGKGQAQTQGQDEGTLFFVSLKFPYLSMAEVRKKIEDKIGPATNDFLTKGQGAVAWDSDKTFVVMWVDRYRANSYCRRITYLSKDIAKELNNYQTRVFNKNELDLIMKLNP